MNSALPMTSSFGFGDVAGPLSGDENSEDGVAPEENLSDNPGLRPDTEAAFDNAESYLPPGFFNDTRFSDNDIPSDTAIRPEPTRPSQSHRAPSEHPQADTVAAPYYDDFLSYAEDLGTTAELSLSGDPTVLFSLSSGTAEFFIPWDTFYDVPDEEWDMRNLGLPNLEQINVQPSFVPPATVQSDPARMPIPMQSGDYAASPNFITQAYIDGIVTPNQPLKSLRNQPQQRQDVGVPFLEEVWETHPDQSLPHFSPAVGSPNLNPSRAARCQKLSPVPDVPMSEAPNEKKYPAKEPLTRRRACMECRRPSKRECKGFPCKKCRNDLEILTEIEPPSISLLGAMYLDLHEWQEVNRYLKTEVAILSSRHVQHSRDGKAARILHINVDDGVRARDFRDLSTVVLDTLGTMDRPELLVHGEKGLIRKPALFLPQFDSIAQERIWSSDARKPNTKLDTTEQAIFSLARDFCGYYAILQHLDKATITNSLLDELATKLVGLEVIYTVVFRLRTLLEELVTTMESLPKSTPESRRYPVALYALEIVYGCMRSYPDLKWCVPETHTLFALKKMLKLLNERATHLRSRVKLHECALSLEEQDYKDLQADFTLKFIRSEKKLPGRLEIAHERRSSLPWNIDLNPLSGAYKDRLLEVLGSRTTYKLEEHSFTCRPRRYSDIAGEDLRNFLSSFTIQSKSKFPKRNREAPTIIGRPFEAQPDNEATSAGAILKHFEVMQSMKHRKQKPATSPRHTIKEAVPLCPDDSLSNIGDDGSRELAIKRHDTASASPIASPSGSAEDCPSLTGLSKRPSKQSTNIFQEPVASRNLRFLGNSEGMIAPNEDLEADVLELPREESLVDEALRLKRPSRKRARTPSPACNLGSRVPKRTLFSRLKDAWTAFSRDN